MSLVPIYVRNYSLMHKVLMFYIEIINLLECALNFFENFHQSTNN